MDEDWIVERRERRTHSVNIDGEEIMLSKSARQRLRKKRLAMASGNDEASSTAAKPQTSAHNQNATATTPAKPPTTTRKPPSVSSHEEPASGGLASLLEWNLQVWTRAVSLLSQLLTLILTSPQLALALLAKPFKASASSTTNTTTAKTANTANTANTKTKNTTTTKPAVTTSVKNTKGSASSVTPAESQKVKPNQTLQQTNPSGASQKLAPAKSAPASKAPSAPTPSDSHTKKTKEESSGRDDPGRGHQAKAGEQVAEAEKGEESGQGVAKEDMSKMSKERERERQTVAAAESKKPATATVGEEKPSSPSEPAVRVKPAGPSAEMCGGENWRRGRFKLGEVQGGGVGHSSMVSSVAIVHDTVVSAAADNCLKVWSWDGGEASSSAVGLKYSRTLTGHADCVVGVALNNTADRAISASRDCNLLVWNPHTGTQVSSLYTFDCLTCLTAAGPQNDPLSVAAVGAASGAVVLWDVAKQRKTAVFKEQGAEQVSCVCVGGSGLEMMVSGHVDAGLRVWDRRQKTGPTHHLAGGQRRIFSVVSDGTMVWAGDFSGSIKVFDLRSSVASASSASLTPLTCKIPNSPLGGQAGPTPIALALSKDGRRMYSSAAAFWEDDEDADVDACLQVRTIGGEYMYTVCGSSGGLVTSMAEAEGGRLITGHQGGGLAAWQLCSENAKETEDMWDGERIGCEDI